LSDFLKKEGKLADKRRRLKLSKTTFLFLSPPHCNRTLNKVRGIHLKDRLGFGVVGESSSSEREPLVLF
jgi:hypothetical protein